MSKASFKKRKLGKKEARGHLKMLHYANYVTTEAPPPVKYDFWKGRTPFPIVDVGNTEYGDCTIASQVLLSQRMERIEQIKTITIPTKNVIDTYLALGCRLYGCGDEGAYELDALNNWRNPETAFKDSKGRPYTIDAFVKINHSNITEFKRALVMAGAKGIKVCFGLPLAWASQSNQLWDIPQGQQPIGNYKIGSWGYHSMTAIATYDENKVALLSTWKEPIGYITWRALAIYADESYLAIDSINSWKKKRIQLDFTQLRADVNRVSSIQI